MAAFWWLGLQIIYALKIFTPKPAVRPKLARLALDKLPDGSPGCG
jgi:hypothetical protein